MAKFGQSFVPALPSLRRGGRPWLLAAAVIAAIIIVIIAYIIFSKPEAVPSAILFEKIFPPGSNIRGLEKINIDIDGILQNPIFKTLREQGPLPLQLPPLGKPNPFL